MPNASDIEALGAKLDTLIRQQGRKFDTLIRLQATTMVDRLPTQRARIAFLSRAGLGPKEIAEILGTTTNTVSVSLSKMKKGSSNDGDG